MDMVKEYLPFLIPLVLIEVVVFVAALTHILKHDKYKVGNRVLWLIVVCVLFQLVGPILYFVIGKSDD